MRKCGGYNPRMQLRNDRMAYRQIGIRHLLLLITACATALMLNQTPLVHFMANTVWVPINGATLFVGGSIGAIIGHAYSRSALGACRGLILGFTLNLFAPYVLQSLLREFR